jgi:hypothetical protein
MKKIKSKAMESSFGHRETCIKEAIKTMKEKAMERCILLITPFIKVIGKEDYKVVWQPLFYQMDLLKKAFLRIISFMVIVVLKVQRNPFVLCHLLTTTEDQFNLKLQTTLNNLSLAENQS